MVIELRGSFYRVQVKTANEITNGAIKCYTRSSANHTTNKEIATYENDVDYFVFYNQDLDKIALVPIEEVGSQQTISLRIKAPENGQKNVKYFSDYSFEKTLCVETLHGTSQEEEEKVRTTMRKRCGEVIF